MLPSVCYLLIVKPEGTFDILEQAVEILEGGPTVSWNVHGPEEPATAQLGGQLRRRCGQVSGCEIRGPPPGGFDRAFSGWESRA